MATIVMKVVKSSINQPVISYSDIFLLGLIIFSSAALVGIPFFTKAVYILKSLKFKTFF